MLTGKNLTDFTDLFSQNVFKKFDKILTYFMAECNSHETPNMYTNLNVTPLNDQEQFRLNKVNEIQDYFVAEIKERELIGINILLLLTTFTSHSLFYL